MSLGWAAFDCHAQALVAYGYIKTNAKDEYLSRLKTIHDGVNKLINKYKPIKTAVESGYVGPKAAGALKLGEARGVIIGCVMQHNPSFLHPKSLLKFIGVNAKSKRDKTAAITWVKTIAQIDLESEIKNKSYRSDVADAIVMAFKAHADLQFEQRIFKR